MPFVLGAALIIAHFVSPAASSSLRLWTSPDGSASSRKPSTPLDVDTLRNAAAARIVGVRGVEVPVNGSMSLEDFDPKAAYRIWVANMLVLWLIWMTLSVGVYLSCYNFRVPVRDEASKADPEETLESGHCACLGESGDLRIFMCACCCPAIRWADTVNLAGLLRVGVAFCLCSLFFLMDGLVLPSLGFGVFFACTLLYYRQQLRRKFGLPYGNCQTCCFDFCFVFWCPWCAIAQEALVVKQAYEIGHPAVRGGPAKMPTGSTWQTAPNVQDFHYFVN